MMRIWALAFNTFRETIRNRILMNILIFAIGLILLSLVVGEWSMGEQVKVIKDFGLSAMSLFGLLIAVFIGIRLMVQELEQKTIYIIAVKPVHRWQIVTGKYLGLTLTLLINIVLMAIALWVVDFIIEGRIDLGLIPAIILIYLEILLMVAFSIFFASLMSPTLGAIATIVIFFMGHLSDYLYDFIRLYPDKGYHWLLKGIYYIVPNLEKLNIKMAAVEHLPQPPHAFAWGVVYGISYILIVMMFSCLIFERKDLK